MPGQLEAIKKASFFIENKKYNEAKKILLEFAENNKNIKLDIKFFFTMYLVSNGLEDIKNSKRYLEKCLKIDDKNHIALNNLANIYLKEGNLIKAEKFYLKALNLNKNYLLAIVNLAILYQDTGKLDESKRFYLRAIELAPKRISLYFNLSRIDENFIDDEKINYLIKLLKSEKKEFSELSYGYFILANYERKKKNFDSEMNYLKRANNYNFQSRKLANQETLNYWNNIIVKKYNNLNFVNKKKNTIFEKINPLFIFGLPRSGSTITEVLLRSNNDIYSFGEASIFNGIIANIFRKNEKSDINLEFVGDKVYKIFLARNFDMKKNRFIDKSLENFFYIDVILKIFPNAKFINTTRNIEDNIFAIYKQTLSKISWTHSIEDILRYMDNYFKVIDYFIKKYPDKIFTLKLEDLSSKPEEITKKLYNFCDLTWTDEVLEFHKKKDVLISTASNIQVRDKIQKYDFDRYKPYKILLRNFLDQYNWLPKK